MSQITIQCRLVSCEFTRQQLWKLMAETNTPLITELLAQVGHHSEFETWRQKGKLPWGLVSKLCQPLKTEERFLGQPSRFYISAIHVVEYIYKSWLALQQRLQQKLQGQKRWLDILQSNTELVEASGCTLEIIRSNSAEILAQLKLDSQPSPSKKSKKPPRQNFDRTLSKALFQTYSDTEDILTRSCVSYLLKNGCQVGEKEENLEKFVQRRRKVEIKIERLTQQLARRMPKGRDLTGTKFLETLFAASNTVPQSEIEARSWQDSLLKKPSFIPFPIAFETNEDLVWSQNQKGRLCVCFSGFSEHIFEIYCDRRQLHWFKRFLEDQQVKRSGKNQHSSSLFTLRSGRIAWQEGEGKGKEWNIHHLTLFCTVDTRLWSVEGTEQVRQEKAVDIANKLTQMKEKGDLSKTQAGYIKRLESTLARISSPFERPSQNLHQGQPHILVGVSLGLDKPATVAVVDVLHDKVLAYQSTRQLLGKNYNLLNRQRRQQQSNSHQRHKGQKHLHSSQVSESELGQYVDRLLAKAIVAIAQTYKAGSIVLPKLGNMREIVQSEIQALAEQKCPNYLEGQREYAKQYRVNIHKWSYGRLIESIKSQAVKVGIDTEEGQQQIRGSPQEKAKDLAISTYRSR